MISLKGMVLKVEENLKNVLLFFNKSEKGSMTIPVIYDISITILYELDFRQECILYIQRIIYNLVFIFK